MNFSQQLDLATGIAIKGDARLIELSKLYGHGHFKVNFLANPVTVLTEHFMNLAASKDTFENELWWEARLAGTTATEKAYFQECQYRHIKFFFFIKFFSVIESEFRILTRKYGVNIMNYGRANFKDIYTFILNKFGLSAQYLPLFDFCRLSRNVIHNMGVHASATQSVLYSSNEYIFKEWAEPQFITAKLQFQIHDDLLRCLIEITQAEEFRLLK